jgi:nickel/cobalt exporter
MSAPVKEAPAKGRVLRSPFLWIGVLLLLAIVGALVFSDSVADLARFSAEYQRRIQQTLSGSLRDIKAGSGSLALWTLATVCFGYGVVHTLGPGHGKAVVVAYFLDSARPRAWIEGIFAGAWIAFTHTLRGAQRRDGLVPADPGDRHLAAVGRHHRPRARASSRRRSWTRARART